MATQKWMDTKLKKEDKPKKLKLFLDDVRNPSDVYGDGGSWIVCRDIDSMKKWLSMGIVGVISLDGDMGKVSDKDIPGGVELLDWMKQRNTWPEDLLVMVHSQNPVKANLMRRMIDEHELTDEDLKEYTIEDVK